MSEDGRKYFSCADSHDVSFFLMCFLHVCFSRVQANLFFVEPRIWPICSSQPLKICFGRLSVPQRQPLGERVDWRQE